MYLIWNKKQHSTLHEAIRAGDYVLSSSPYKNHGYEKVNDFFNSVPCSECLDDMVIVVRKGTSITEAMQNEGSMKMRLMDTYNATHFEQACESLGIGIEIHPADTSLEAWLKHKTQEKADMNTTESTTVYGMKVVVTGPRGCGKTQLLNFILRNFKLKTDDDHAAK